MVIEGRCKLCLEARELCRSHVLPEFGLDGLYSDPTRPRRFLALSGNPEPHAHGVKIEQKGLRERLLCAECETRLSRFETYVSRLLRDGLSLPTPGTMKRNLADYSLLKSFQFSLLWRTHLSTARMFQVVDLGPHADRIRRMLLDENPGTARQYPCAIGVAYLGTQARPGLVTPPFALKREGRHWYVISFAGFNWIFLVSNDMERHTWRNWCVQEDSALPIYASDILRYDGFRELARDIIVKNLPALVRVGAIKDTETDTP